MIDDRGQPIVHAPRLQGAGLLLRRVPSRQWRHIGLVSIMVGVCWYAFVGSVWPLSMWGNLLLMALVSVGVFGVVVAEHAAMQRARRLVRFGQCTCGYRLEALQVEDDGCVVCPECGAAWRVGDRSDA